MLNMIYWMLRMVTLVIYCYDAPIMAQNWSFDPWGDHRVSYPWGAPLTFEEYAYIQYKCDFLDD